MNLIEFSIKCKYVQPLETNLEEPYVSSDHYVLTRKLIKIFHDIEQKEGNEVRGAVLIFLPGIVDIDNLHKELRKE
jgi:HrpA-like RNA helicase